MKTARLDWRSSCKGPLEKIQYILTKSILTDVCVKIIYNGKITEFKAHKLLLQACSEAFEAMFSSSYKEGRSNTLEIKDVDPKTFELLLKHMCGQSIVFPNIEESWKLYALADRYLISETRDLCLEFIIQNLKPENCIKCFESAEQYDLLDLRGKCLQMFREKTDEIVKNDGFLRANFSTIKLLLEQETLNVREIDLFNSVDSWIKSFLQRKGEQMQNVDLRAIMSEISFLSMTALEFQSGPANCELISWDEKYAILSILTIPGCCLPVPEGFRNRKRNSPQILSAKNYPKNKKEELNTPVPALRLTVNKTIQLTGIKVFTRKDGGNSEEIEFNVQEENNGVQCVGRFKGKSNCWSTLMVRLEKPFELVAGKSYILNIKAPGQRNCVDLDRVQMNSNINNNIVVTFSRYENQSTHLPLALLMYQ